MRKEKCELTRVAYSPAEFAESCGRHPSWAYRLLYSGKVHAITEFGRLLIPASELQRVLSLAKTYDPTTKRKPELRPEADREQAGA
jgi:hypothetical protein